MLRDEGNAYKLDGDTLLSAPLLLNAEEEDNWSEVDFDRIDETEKTYCLSIRVALVAQERR
jgi:hypothetical protein